MLEWLIVGGGIHGTYISNFLLKKGLTKAKNIAVIDPYSEPLQQWKDRTARVSMRFLRSPGEHSVDIGSLSLIRYARRMKGGAAELYSSYQRPSLRIFNSHCDETIRQNSLKDIRYQATASRLERKDGCFILSTDRGERLHSKRVVLSLGCTDLSYPAWAQELKDSCAPVAHVFDSDYLDIKERSWSRAIVVGNGISAVQLAMGLARDYQKPVTLIHSRPIRTYQFDADPCWILDGGCLPSLSRQKDLVKRRNIVDNGRHWGSVPEDIKNQLAFVSRSADFACVESHIVSAYGSQSRAVLELADGRSLEGDLVVLASGFSRQIPGGDFIQSSIKSLDLDCAPCGFPCLDEYLQWSENLYVSGPLADLEVGPASRNIVGARLAAEKIAKSVLKRRTNLREHHYYYFARKRNN